MLMGKNKSKIRYKNGKCRDLTLKQIKAYGGVKTFAQHVKYQRLLGNRNVDIYKVKDRN